MRRALPARDATPAAFAPYGWVVQATEDGAPFDAKTEPALAGFGAAGAAPPRFYVMRLPARGLASDRITHHKAVTQTLGGLGDRPWFLVVAAPTGGNPPGPLTAFRVPAQTFIVLKAGTWHAGPLFDGETEGEKHGERDFFNAELADTNVVDHTTHVFEGGPVEVVP
jgi:ureidoglycolate hydrolase